MSWKPIKLGTIVVISNSFYKEGRRRFSVFFQLTYVINCQCMLKLVCDWFVVVVNIQNHNVLLTLDCSQTNLQDQAARDKALQQMASMSSAQIVSASAIHNKAMGQNLPGLPPGMPPSAVRPPYPGTPSVSFAGLIWCWQQET